MNSYTQYERVRFGADSRVTHAVQRLILLTCATFALQLILDIPFGRPLRIGAGAAPGGFISSWLAFQPSTVVRGALWKPFTYLFLHGGLMHLFFNMLWLFFFGPDVERALGTRQFYRFYFVCGALGVFATFLTLGGRLAEVSVVGASGAVMGMMVAFAMVNPERQFFLFPLPVPV
ncbi:MAG: rhomboid family intramembrane serine protease, partial [Nitrospiraceae bacterium]|nr:rhomboid family intramembrane serine protease [Nitrospiraceae bacterium]